MKLKSSVIALASLLMLFAGVSQASSITSKNPRIQSSVVMLSLVNATTDNATLLQNQLGEDVYIVFRGPAILIVGNTNKTIS